MRARSYKGTLSPDAAACLVGFQPFDRNNLADPWQTKSKNKRAPVAIARAEDAQVPRRAEVQNENGAPRRRSDDQMELVISEARNSDRCDNLGPREPY
jgi:hypothetical protein